MDFTRSSPWSKDLQGNELYKVEPMELQYISGMDLTRLMVCKVNALRRICKLLDFTDTRVMHYEDFAR